MESKQRFLFVDGLRGIAALTVLLHHATCRTICGPLLHQRLPEFGWDVLLNLKSGVEIFFVISGFVIAHSLRESTYTPREVGLFAARRQLRLDPPYWVVMAAHMACWSLATRSGMTVKESDPATVWSVFTNFVYLNGLLRLPPVLDVAWTLCIEVQFYLAFILLMAVGRLRGPTSSGGPSRIAQVLLFASSAASLLADPETLRGATLAPYWCYFGAGVLCYWVYRRQVGVWQLGVLGLGFAASAIVRHFSVPVCVGLATVVALHVIGRAGGLTRVLRNRPIQYFGAISYSLYLVHQTVLGIVTRGGSRFLHGSDARAAGLVVVGVLLSVGVAHLLHVCVERPSMRFARSFRRGGQAVELPGGETPAAVTVTV